MDMENYNLIIIGAGPAGISCALAAEKNNLSYLLMDKGNIADAIINFPVTMTFFSTSDQLELENIPFNSQNFRPTRIEAVKYYQSIVSHYNLNVSVSSLVTKVEKHLDTFIVSFVKNDNEHKISCDKLVVATGYFDRPNLLGVPGEDLPHVSHYFDEALRYFNQQVVIVGGKNSAVETALELYRSGAKVSIVHRRDSIQESVKYWILPDIINRIKEGSIKTYFNAQVKKITSQNVIVSQDQQETEIAADAVFLLTGYLPDIRLLDQLSVKYHADTLECAVNESTLETNIPGVYLAGSIIAGKNHNRIFIENSREHGSLIVADVVQKLSD
jgi:thioredoxin reductase (NADPH)